MYKVLKNNSLFDIIEKPIFVKNVNGIVKIVHDRTQADGIVINAVPYNVIGGPSNFPDAEAVEVKQIFDSGYLAKLESATVVAESQLNALRIQIEEAKQILSDLESVIVDLDPEGVE